MTIDIKKMQATLAIHVDGIIGPNTLRALFARMGAAPSRACELGMAANVHFRTYGILDSGLRLAHFMGQIAHESAGFYYMEEIASGSAYEGRADLGNTISGDGKRYKGRGPIQITGRANYRKYGRALGIDFEGHPEIVSMPSVGLMAAGLYWRDSGLNALADADDIRSITKRINGGMNGFDDRVQRTEKAKALIL